MMDDRMEGSETIICTRNIDLIMESYYYVDQGLMSPMDATS